jgi:hypothetical protein
MGELHAHGQLPDGLEVGVVDYCQQRLQAPRGGQSRSIVSELDARDGG